MGHHNNSQRILIHDSKCRSCEGGHHELCSTYKCKCPLTHERATVLGVLRKAMFEHE